MFFFSNGLFNFYYYFLKVPLQMLKTSEKNYKNKQIFIFDIEINKKEILGLGSTRCGFFGNCFLGSLPKYFGICSSGIIGPQLKRKKTMAKPSNFCLLCKVSPPQAQLFSKKKICKKYVLPSLEECKMRSSEGMVMLNIVLDTFNVCV